RDLLFIRQGATSHDCRGERVLRYAGCVPAQLSQDWPGLRRVVALQRPRGPFAQNELISFQERNQMRYGFRNLEPHKLSNELFSRPPISGGRPLRIGEQGKQRKNGFTTRFV